MLAPATGWDSCFPESRLMEPCNWQTKTRPDWLPEDTSSWKRSPWKGMQVRLQQRSAMHAVDWCMPVSTSQIEGSPAWVQDSAFPKCLDCSETMKFVAQVDNGQFPYHEGVYYAFFSSLP